MGPQHGGPPIAARFMVMRDPLAHETTFAYTDPHNRHPLALSPSSTL